MTSRLVAVLLAFALGSTSTALGQTVDYGQGWRETENRLVPRVRLTAEILDSQPAVLEAEVKSDGAPYTYSVDWGDGSRPEPGRRHGEGVLRLTHDYNHIGTFQPTLEVRLAGEHPQGGEPVARIRPPLVIVSDDDGHAPVVEWKLPPPVVRPGERAVIGWRVSDRSGLDYVVVVVVGSQGRPLAHFEKAEGEYDFTGLGLGVFRVELRAQDNRLHAHRVRRGYRRPGPRWGARLRRQLPASGQPRPARPGQRWARRCLRSMSPDQRPL